jgi:hypothetical protein
MSAHDQYYDEDRYRRFLALGSDLYECCDCGNWTDRQPSYTIDETPDGVLCSECD